MNELESNLKTIGMFQVEYPFRTIRSKNQVERKLMWLCCGGCYMCVGQCNEKYYFSQLGIVLRT